MDGRRRAEWIAANGPCALCGSEEGLTIDHINPDLKAATLKGKNRNGTHRGTGGIWSWPKARRDPELAKSRVLCGRCHRIKSAGERARGEAHGHAKLTAEAVIEIRAAYTNKEKQTDPGSPLRNLQTDRLQRRSPTNLGTY